MMIVARKVKPLIIVQKQALKLQVQQDPDTVKRATEESPEAQVLEHVLTEKQLKTLIAEPVDDIEVDADLLLNRAHLKLAVTYQITQISKI